MIASAHIAAGAVVGVLSARATRAPVAAISLALVLGFLSHFVLDMVPHADYAPLSRTATVRLALSEVAVTSGLVWLILLRRLPSRAALPVLAGVGASALADAKFVARLVLPPETAEVIAAYGDRLHAGIHAAPPVTIAAGWSTEIATALLLLAVLRGAWPRAIRRSVPRGSAQAESRRARAS